MTKLKKLQLPVVLFAWLALAGCSTDEIRGLQAKMDNGGQGVEFAIDPSVKDIAFANLKFERLVGSKTFGDALLTTNRSGFAAKGTVVYKKSSCGLLIIKGKFLAADGKMLTTGTAIASNSGIQGMPDKYTKGEESKFAIPSGDVDANISKVVITGYSCT